MRRLLTPLALLAWFSTGAAHANEALERTYAERIALLAIDQRCALLAPPVRAALQAGANQGRSALLRAGATIPATDRLAANARAVMAQRGCQEPAVAEAARSARVGFAGYQRLAEMRFPGDGRHWTARRRSDPSGWLAFQDIATARFGLRLGAHGAEAAFALPLAAGDAVPSTARLVLRDLRRAPASPLDIPGRTARGFSFNAPHPAMATQIMAQRRSIGPFAAPLAERAVVFAFPSDALARLAALDPREAAVVEVDGLGVTQRYLVEIGDIAAALAFLRAGES